MCAQKLRSKISGKRKSYNGHRKMIAKYRDQLHEALKKLDKLEATIEADQDYDSRMADLGRPNKRRTVSGLNLPRKGTVKLSGCRLRAEPSTKGEVLGSYGRGRKIDMTYHNSKWFSLVYGGQKAFISKKCI